MRQRVVNGLHRAYGDLETARRLAHTLKGTAATLGADVLATRAARLESLIKEHPHGLSADLLGPEIDEVCRAIGEIAAALKIDK